MLEAKFGKDLLRTNRRIFSKYLYPHKSRHFNHLSPHASIKFLLQNHLECYPN